jgi:predicted nucleic acid-binding Zn ribbon protein
MSDPLLTVCPECGKSTYVKQVTAAGFQLKGSGWYVTDFRNNGTGATGKAAPSGGSSSHDTGTVASSSSSSSTASASAPAAPASGSAAT